MLGNRASVRVAVLLGPVMLFATGCEPDVDADEAAAELLAADRARAEAIRSGGRDGYREYFARWAEDGVLYPAGRQTVRGREAVIRFVFEPPPSDEAGLAIRPLHATVAASGELGYTLGTYERSVSGADGGPLRRPGRYLAVWRRDPRGVWRTVVEIHNPLDVPR